MSQWQQNEPSFYEECALYYSMFFLLTPYHPTEQELFANNFVKLWLYNM